jgi:hypothetical protein
MIQLRLNPAIDIQACARLYAERKIVQILDVFEPASAEALAVAACVSGCGLEKRDVDAR